MSRASCRQGAIAQLGERLNGIQEVGGSIPPGSTKNSQSFTTLVSRHPSLIPRGTGSKQPVSRIRPIGFWPMVTHF